MPAGAPGPILLITKLPFHEPRDGGALRVAAVVAELRNHGHDVLALPVRGADPAGRARPRAARYLRGLALVLGEVLRTRSVSVARWFSPAAVARIVQVLDTAPPSVVVVEYSQLMIYAPLFDRPLVLDMHNIESELLRNYAGSARTAWRRIVAGTESRRVAALERRALRRADAVTTVSERDAGSARALAPDVPPVRIRTAPNGVNDAAFEAPRAAEPAGAVFVGHLGWRPNVDAARWLVRSVWPLVLERRPDAVLRLVGRAPAPEVRELAGPRVEVIGDVPSTIEYLQRAAVATAPLLAAGGTRLKILEALACGVPVVSTPLGALGLESLGAPYFRIEGSAERFAEALAAFLDRAVDPAAPRAAAERFRWHRSLAPLLDAVQQLDASQAVRTAR